MAKLKPITAIAPSSWASYLVNGDASGIDDRERAQANAFARWMDGPIVSCDDYGFAWSHDGSQFGALGADCQTYTALIQESDE